MITVTPFLADAADAKLEDWGPLEEATGEPMQTSGTTLWSGEGDQDTGVWECTPGPSRWTLTANRHRPGRHRGLPPRLGRHLADPRDHPQALRLVLNVAPVLKVVLAGTFRRRHLGSLTSWNIALWEAAAARFRAWRWAP
jgi:hypothetical protein